MDQDNKQNTSGQVSGKDLPPLSGIGVDVKAPKEVSEKIPVSSGSPIKPEPVESKPVDVSTVPENEGLPPLETAEDETFNPEMVNKKEEEKVEKTTLPPLPDSGAGEVNESLKEVKEMGEINSENQETPPPPPPEETPVAPGKMEEKPLTTDGIDMNDDGGGEKKKGKKKISKKTIVGGVIALVLLIGVPVLALNLDYFRGDVRERASNTLSTGYGAAGCVGKTVGDSCGNDGTCKLVNGPNNTKICGCVNQKDPSSGCNDDKAYGCGAPPDEIPSYSETGSVGPFPENGSLVVYLTTFDIGAINGINKISFRHNGLRHEVMVPNETVKQKRIVTNIEVKAGETVEILEVDLNQQTLNGDCPPVPAPPFKAIGWMPVGADNTCGTGVSGPPTGGKCTPYPIHNVSEALSWANNYDEKDILGTQCWADWMEWAGDYDFNDYLLQFSYEPSSISADMCVEIKIYTLQDGSWTETLVAEVGQHAVVGDTIRLALKGNSSAFVGGRFRIAVDEVSGNWIETNNKNGNGELYLDYQLESGGSYSVEGEIRK